MSLDPELLRELLQTFKDELDEQTQIIIDGLINLEKDQHNQDEKIKLIEMIFRCAHNIKGASRGLGINDVGVIAHKIETLFHDIKTNKLFLTQNMISQCLNAIDKINLALKSFIENKPLPFNLDELLKTLDASDNLNKEADVRENFSKNDYDQAKIDHNANIDQVNIQDKNHTPPESDTHESIRVSIDKIDRVFALLEEIQINKISIEDNYNELNLLAGKNKEFLSLWKQIFEWSIKSNKSENDDNYKVYHSANDHITEMSHLSSRMLKSMRAQLNELTILSNSLQEEVRLLRLIPAGTFLRTLPRYVRDLSQELNKEIDLVVTGDDVRLDKLVLEGLKDPLIHIIRNAIDHGIESPDIRQSLGKPKSGHISVSVVNENNRIFITISDDGGGIDTHKITAMILEKKLATSTELKSMSEDEILDFIFRSGFSTKDIITDISGRGIGMDVVRSNLNELKGKVSVVTKFTQGTTFCLNVPLTLSSDRGLLINSGKEQFVIPTNSIKRVLSIHPDEIFDVEGSQVLLLDNHPVPLRVLSDVLKLSDDKIMEKDRLSVIVLEKGWDTVALLIDEIIGEREIVIKPLRQPLANISCVSGGTLLEHNQVAVVLNAVDIINIALHVSSVKRVELEVDNIQTKARPHILVVDDSITTRTLEKNILESRNYQVTITVNGKEAWDLLQKQKFSLLITDVNMPIMDGFTLTEHVKQHDQLRHLPVIIVTSLGSDSEKARGVEVGADAYIVKSEFESGALLDIVKQLV